MDTRDYSPASFSRGGGSDGPSIGNADGVVSALESVWLLVRREGLDRVKPPGLRGELQRVTTEARAANIPPEQLLWLLKCSWRNLPEVRRIDRPEVATDLLGQIVTMCIEEYFT